VPERQLRPVLTRHAVATGMARPGSCATILSRAGRRSSSVAQAVGRPDAVDDVELPQPHRHLALPPPVILPTTAAGHGVDQAVPHQHPMIMIRDGIRPGQPLRPSSNSMRRAPHRGMVAAQLAVPRIRPGRYVGARPIRATFRSIRPGRGRPDPRTRLAMTQPAARHRGRGWAHGQSFRPASHRRTRVLSAWGGRRDLVARPNESQVRTPGPGSGLGGSS
jgi:hypothetical protein